ncbi:CocE/NonD family hydrolase [Halovivax cerinus]|uniref:CocE/NonD family hydrolase n=1 Tax=Halovivax cerinus TaxID=1487865 RepID=A0ABD5NRZ3_9EURY|nr:CocE/NonD family hydrolase [Halovivax cerinus]
MTDASDVPYDPDRVTVEETTHSAPDGTRLAITVFRPETATADDPAPLLLQRTPYGKPSDPPAGGFAAAALADGYAIAFEDVRGRGESDGAFMPWVNETEDGAATIDWLGAKPWVSAVGMFGGSSPGQVQLFAAAARPDALGAIAPTFTPSDLQRSDFFQDGAMSALTLLTWTLDDAIAGHSVDRLERRGEIDAEAAEALRTALESGLERLPALAAHRPLVDVPANVLADAPDDVDPTDLIPFWEEWTSRPSYDDFWGSFDPEMDYDRIAVPGLHTTGWYELCQHGTVTNFRMLSRRSPAPQHLVIGPWSHQNQGSVLGEVDFGTDASADAYGRDEQLLAFFDTYLRDDPTPPFASSGESHVETFRASILDRSEAAPSPSEGSDAPGATDDEAAVAGAGRWIAHDGWPPADASRKRWFLSSGGEAVTDLADGRLVRDLPEKFQPSDTWTHDPADPVPTRGGPLCCGEHSSEPGAFDRRDLQRRDDVVTFTTDPFETPVELAGPVSLRLTAATTAPDTDFTATLSHVLPDGRAYNLCEGIRRAQYRYGRDRSVPAPEAEAPMTVEIDMWNVHYAVPAGGRLRLEVASSNFPRFDPHPGTLDPWTATDDEVRTAEQTLFHELDRESVLTVSER